jgi:hypothetical protein
LFGAFFARRLLSNWVQRQWLCFMIWSVDWCSTLSKAFSKSNFSKLISFLDWYIRRPKLPILNCSGLDESILVLMDESFDYWLQSICRSLVMISIEVFRREIVLVFHSPANKLRHASP